MKQQIYTAKTTLNFKISIDRRIKVECISHLKDYVIFAVLKYWSFGFSVGKKTIKYLDGGNILTTIKGFRLTYWRQQ